MDTFIIDYNILLIIDMSLMNNILLIVTISYDMIINQNYLISNCLLSHVAFSI